MKRSKILDSGQIKRKLERMARQLLEVHYNEKELVLLGVDGNGIEVAKRLEAILNKIGKMPVRLESIKLNKKKPLDSEIKSSFEESSLTGKTVIVIDDVLNSGRTLIHAVKHVLEFNPKGIYTAILVDRIHRSFPVRADYCGLSLSTHLNQHISVNLNSSDNSKDEVYLDL
jgi:pyrimidine operon attenuation protein/uracil phosphoribosyltransferase